MTPAVRRFRSRDGWLRGRRIGSSDVAAIMKKSTKRSPWHVYERLVHGIDHDDTSDDVSAMRGVRLEPHVLRRYMRQTGTSIRPTPAFTLYDREDWATATPDALGDGLIVEAKTDRIRDRWGEPTTIERWERAAGAIVRPDYYLQVAHQLFVLDLPAADLAVLLPGDDPFLPELRVYRILRDRELEERMVDHLRAWWRKHVVEKEPPPFDGSLPAGAWLTRRERFGARAATPAEAALAHHYEQCKAAALHWENARKQTGQMLIHSAGDVAQLDLPIGRVTVVRNNGKPWLDERGLLRDHPELEPVLDNYRKRSAPYSYPSISGGRKP